jgi:histidine triad (HIT) family protein
MALMDCLFCKIANKEISSDTLYYESDKAVAFLDINPISPGHSLVVPESHVDNILNLNNAELPGFFGAVKEATRILDNVLSPNGFNIGINHGQAGGQVVDHLHVHVVPRYLDDGGGSIQTIVNNSETASPKEIIDKIRKVAD